MVGPADLVPKINLSSKKKFPEGGGAFPPVPGPLLAPAASPDVGVAIPDDILASWDSKRHLESIRTPSRGQGARPRRPRCSWEIKANLCFGCAGAGPGGARLVG